MRCSPLRTVAVLSLDLTTHRSLQRSVLIALLLLGLVPLCRAQTAGPRSPTTTASDASVGTIAWSTPANSTASDNVYTTATGKGLSNYLKVTNFGFTLPNPSGVAGIQLGVERNTSGSSDVAVLNTWSTGLTKTVSAGTNRCLIVTYAQENGTNSRDITSMTYGGQAMTQVAEIVAGPAGGFNARLEVWMLPEAQIALAGSTTIAPTYGAYSAYEYCEAFSSAVFQNVDQLVPVYSQQTTGAVNTTNPNQLSAAINTLAGSMAINVVTNGNNTTPTVTDGGTNTYTINSGYTEGTDLYFANTGIAPTSGACIETAHKAITANGTEQPSCTFNGSVNRWAMIGLTLQRARELDYQVKLVKAGVIGGTDLAGSAAWPLADAYTNYGGATTTWGRTWTNTDINATTFGAAVAARMQNGIARVDHMRITVYYFSTLPIELLDFRAKAEGRTVRLDWITATEHNNDRFVVQRSRDGIAFEDVGELPGAGNSLSTLYYTSRDEHPYSGTSYYRLRQVDVDGTTTDSPLVAVKVIDDELVVAPNPTDGSFTVYDISLERDQVAVYGADMRLIRTHVGAGVNPIIHLEDLPDGIYVLMVRTGDDVRTTRIVKESRSK